MVVSVSIDPVDDPVCIILLFFLSRSSDTVLGETGDPRELFLIDDCEDNPLGAIMDKVEVSLISL